MAASWSALRKKLTFVERKGYVPVEVLPEEIARFEERHDFPLPPSYAAFVREIGPGTLSEFYVIHGPTPGRYSLQGLIKEMRGNSTLLEVYRDAPLISRMVPFGTTIGGDIFVWDPDTKRKRGAVEYDIFALPRDRRSVVRVAGSFRSFVNDVCLGHAFFDIVYAARDPEWKVEYTFRPDSRRVTKRSSKPARK
jgi:hypothetical protein